jgi:hypothetical protein
MDNHGGDNTDNGDDYEKALPHSTSLMSPPVHAMASKSTYTVAEVAANSNTTVVTPLSLLRLAEPLSRLKPVKNESPASEKRTLQVAPPSQKNRRKGDGGSGKMQKNRVHRQINSRQDEDIVSTHDNPEDEVWSSLRPGAVAVGDIATRSGRPSTPANPGGQFITDSIGVVVDPSGGAGSSEPQIVAFLAPDDDDVQQIEARIAQKAEELVRRQMEEGDVILAAEMNDDDDSSRTFFGLKKRTFWLVLGVLVLLLIVGSVIVGGVLSSTGAAPNVPTPAPTTQTPAPTTTPTPAPTFGDPLLEELRSLDAISNNDISLFSDRKSPQSQALAWMKNDPIVMSSGRSTRDLLQRYVLAILYYSTYGPNWVVWDAWC